MQRKTKASRQAKTTAPKTKTRTPARKRELVSPRGDARFVRRDEQGRFDDVVDVGRSFAQDRRRKSKTVVPSGMGDRGDQKQRAPKSGSAGTRSPAPRRAGS